MNPITKLPLRWRLKVARVICPPVIYLGHMFWLIPTQRIPELVQEHHRDASEEIRKTNEMLDKKLSE